MARLMSLLSLWLYLFPLALSADFESVTISRDLDNVVHTCVSKCLYYTIYSDMGKAMGCDDPYDNNCYCATASASASQADAWMSKCASNTCSAGDRSRDLSSMQSIYASYCMGAGFTQPGATNWYNPAEATEEPQSPSGEDDDSTNAEPSKTVDSAVETTTQMTIVTQTTEGGAGPSKSRVTVEATSTYYVNPDGSPAQINLSDSSDNSGVKIGVGVAVPVVAIAAIGLFVWWFIRRRKQRQQAQTLPTTQPVTETTTGGGAGITPERKDTIQRKPVGATAVSPVSSESQTNELSGVGVQRELSGREVQPFVTPSPPVQVPGQHEMTGDGWRPNLEMDGRDARVEMSGEARPPELPGQTGSPPPVYTAHETTQRWELPDNSR
ncbi:hypothetical protein CEP54_009138 [Fusarium duplospermum]|uniref:Extracellular membrane protein CFEM domain-containing protein n=1 Tax=Fusarium duplospermum TaxID=1325734 RepID=A0A428PS13_9HYPO|nr:hypothetical protein CEP54_009138 [Fusarium duplospermum]